MASNPSMQPRQQETYYKWWAIIATATLFLLVVIQWLNPNAWVLSIAIIALLIMLFFFSKKPPVWDIGHAIKITREREADISGGILDHTYGNCQVVPHGPYWHVNYIKEAVTYTIFPEQQRIIGRRIRDPDSIIAQSDRSDTIRKSFQQKVHKNTLNEEYDRLGLEREEDDENDNTTT